MYSEDWASCSTTACTGVVLLRVCFHYPDYHANHKSELPFHFTSFFPPGSVLMSAVVVYSGGAFLLLYLFRLRQMSVFKRDLKRLASTQY